MQVTNGPRFGASTAVTGIMALTLVLLIVRSIGLYPSIFGDEYTYSTMSRLVPLSAVSIPDYLYFSIYKLTHLCGTGFMGCAKLFNALFFVAAAPFIYLTARRYCGTRISVLIVAISMLGPINSYTAFFMPEALFFLSFWVSISFFLSLDAQSPVKKWIIFGVMMGGSSLIKPHALFVIPAYCLCIMFFAYKSIDTWKTTGLKNAAIFVATMLATKFLFSYLVAGKSGLTLFGNFYTSTLETSTTSLQRYVDILLAAPRIAEGHLLANTLMFGTALAIVIFGTVKALSSKTVLAQDKFAFCTLALFLNLVTIVALFSASVAGANAVETAFRLHMRYYDFMLPLLFIAAGAQVNVVNAAPLKYWKLAVAVILVVIIGYAALTHMHPFTTSFVDNPELRGYTLNGKWLIVLASLSAFSLFLWSKSVSSGAIFFMVVYLPLSVTVSTINNNSEVRQRMVPDAYDRAGLFARSYLPPSELSKLLVVGENAPSILKSLFYVEDMNAGPDLSYIAGVPYTAAQSSADKKWILAIGDVDFVEGDFDVMRFNGYSLAKKATPLYPLVIDFRDTTRPDSVTKITGLSQAESWGTWSDGPNVEIRFAKPLPPAFELIISSKAYGPNANREFDVEVDGHLYPIKLDANVASHTLSIKNPGSAAKLVIKVPLPTSPKQLGISEDGRLLGLGLNQLEINPLK
jgi:phosphoglycerol transferase